MLGLPLNHFFKKLITFVEKRYASTIIQQDLNPLLHPNTFRQLRHTLHRETITLLQDELNRVVAKS